MIRDQWMPISPDAKTGQWVWVVVDASRTANPSRRVGLGRHMESPAGWDIIATPYSFWLPDTGAWGEVTHWMQAPALPDPIQETT